MFWGLCFPVAIISCSHLRCFEYTFFMLYFSTSSRLLVFKMVCRCQGWLWRRSGYYSGGRGGTVLFRAVGAVVERVVETGGQQQMNF